MQCCFKTAEEEVISKQHPATKAEKQHSYSSIHQDDQTCVI